MQTIIRRDLYPKEFQSFADRNLTRQFEFLEETVKSARVTGNVRINDEIILELNKRAVMFLCDAAGEYRRKNIRITNTKHQPPDFKKVRALMDKFIQYIEKNWDEKSSMHLASYALWRLGWIHPFVEGNGRTARAVCMLILSLKRGTYIPGRNIVPKQVRKARIAYYAALRVADEIYLKKRTVDVSALEAYLNKRLFRGLSRTMLSRRKF